jgi:hypothetical protein
LEQNGSEEHQGDAAGSHGCDLQQSKGVVHGLSLWSEEI